MSSKTKILLLKKRELIYTLLFAALAVILIVLMIWMFLPAVRKSSQASASFSPGIYTSQVTLQNNTMDVEVRADHSGIRSIELRNLSDAVSAMYPAIQPSLWISWPARSVTASLWKISIMKKAVSILPRCCWVPSVQHWNWPEKFNPLSQAIQLFFPDLYAGITRHT